MSALTLASVPNQADESVDVAVPEFGIGEDGEALVVHVRPMTVSTYSLLNTLTATVRLNRAKNEWEPAEAHDASAVIAALCSYDDDGNLVFGTDYWDAVKRVEGLHARYRPAVLRIANAVVEISKLDGAPIEKAKKN